MTEPRVVSVNVGATRSVRWQGRDVTTAIWKAPAVGPVEVRGVNIVGDDQADRRVHGGADKAVYAYAAEDYDWWSSTLGPLAPGTFGENLTTTGLDLNSCRIGDHWALGSTVLEVAQPRSPCFKLGIRMGDDTFPSRFDEAARPGVYLRIVTPGWLTTDDRVSVVAAEPPAIEIGWLAGTHLTAAVLKQIAADRRVPREWRRAAERLVAG